MPATIYQFKPAFQRLLRPLSDALWRLEATPNQVTAGAVILSILTGSVLSILAPRKGALLLLAPVLLVRMALNAIDGMLANDHAMKTRLGAILNELGDVISDAALYLPLALGFGFSPALVTLVVLLSVVSEMAGVLSAGRCYDGPMGKSDRAFLLGLATLAAGLGVPSGRWQDFLLVAMIALLVLTIRNRVRRALREAS